MFEFLSMVGSLLNTLLLRGGDVSGDTYELWVERMYNGAPRYNMQLDGGRGGLVCPL